MLQECWALFFVQITHPFKCDQLQLEALRSIKLQSRIYSRKRRRHKSTSYNRSATDDVYDGHQVLIVSRCVVKCSSTWSANPGQTIGSTVGIMGCLGKAKISTCTHDTWSSLIPRQKIGVWWYWLEQRHWWKTNRQFSTVLLELDQVLSFRSMSWNQ